MEYDTEQINRISPAELEAHGFLKKSERGEQKENHGYECVYCNSGNGKNRSGALNFDYRSGAWQHYCHSCGNGGDNVKFFQTVFNADFQEACRRATEEFNLNTSDKKSTSYYNIRARNQLPKTKPEELPLIAADIATAREMLRSLPVNQSRGIKMETLEYFGCGYLERWNHPVNRLKGQQYLSRRIIVPTSDGEHYLAVKLDADRKPGEQYAKVHAGAKTQVFNAADLQCSTVIVTEGELNAMSIFQALYENSSPGNFFVRERNVGIVATLSAQGWQSLIIDKIDRHEIEWRKFIIVYDNDDTGHKQSALFRDALLRRNFPATCRFLADYTAVPDDANDILKRSQHELQIVMKKIIADSEIEFADVQHQIELKLESTPNNLPADQREFLFSGDKSDLDNARRLEYLFGDRVKFVADLNQWATFKNGLWRLSEEGDSAVAPFFTDLADIMLDNAADKNEFNMAKKLKTGKSVSSAIKMLKSLVTVRISRNDLNTHNNLINCPNGVVDLQTGKFYDTVDPALMITQRTGAIYRANYRNPIVDKFLSDILPDEDTRMVLLRFLGYGLTGEANEEKSLFAHGGGGNGKGSLTKTVARVMGDYASVIKSSALVYNSRSNDPSAATTDLNPLEDCRLALAEEFPQGQRLDVAKYKNLQGGDLIAIRKLHREQIFIEPHFALFLSGNYLPELSDTHDPGLLRRIMVVYFTESFIGEKADTNLKAKLNSPDARAGFLNILVEQAGYWYRDGLLLPSGAMKRATNDYFSQNDFIGAFIDEFCTYNPHKSISRKEFLNKLKNEYPGECARQFGNRDRDITDAVKRFDGIDYKRIKGSYHFFGIAWNSDDTYRGEPVEDYDLSQFD